MINSASFEKLLEIIDSFSFIKSNKVIIKSIILKVN